MSGTKKTMRDDLIEKLKKSRKMKLAMQDQNLQLRELKELYENPFTARSKLIDINSIPADLIGKKAADMSIEIIKNRDILLEKYIEQLENIWSLLKKGSIPASELAALWNHYMMIHEKKDAHG